MYKLRFELSEMQVLIVDPCMELPLMSFEKICLHMALLVRNLEHIVPVDNF